jgi:heme A synthase
LSHKPPDLAIRLEQNGKFNVRLVYFLAYTVIYAVVGAVMITSTNLTALTVAGGVAQGLTILGLVVLMARLFAK